MTQELARDWGEIANGPPPPSRRPPGLAANRLSTMYDGGPPGTGLPLNLEYCYIENHEMNTDEGGTIITEKSVLYERLLLFNLADVKKVGDEIEVSFTYTAAHLTADQLAQLWGWAEEEKTDDGPE